MTAELSNATAWSPLVLPQLQAERVPRAERSYRRVVDPPRDDEIVRERSGAAAGNGSDGEVGKSVQPGLAWVNEDIDKLDDTFEDLFKEATKAE